MNTSIQLSEIQKEFLRLEIERIKCVGNLLRPESDPKEIQMAWQTLQASVFALKDLYYELTHV